MKDHFYCVYDWMTKDLGLRGNERDVFAVIYSFTESCGQYTGSLQYLADKIAVTRRTAIRCLQHLTGQGLLLKQETLQKGVKLCTYRAAHLRPVTESHSLGDKMTSPVKDCHTPCDKPAPDPVTIFPVPGDKMTPNNKEYNKEYNKEDNKERYKGDNGKVSRGTGRANPSPTRHAYGEYQNVLLSDGELETLKREYPEDWQRKVDHLSEYMASTGRRYHNHLATIRLWAKKDAPPEKPKGRFADLKGGVML